MFWTELKFGKHKGKTLPQVLGSDPDWFFWAFEENVFSGKGKIESEANDLFKKATNIKIPNNKDDTLIVEYFIHPPSRKFSHFVVVKKSKPIHEGSSPTFRKNVIDMSAPRQIANYDKLGFKEFLKPFKHYLFGKETTRLTKQRCEEFFSNPIHFVK